MSDEGRPNPDQLLEAVSADDKKGRGSLKIFLGMCAGVGKTYTMLGEAHIVKKEGVDVIVGIVDTHGREDTAHLLAGLELLPPKKIIYREKTFDEFDIDQVLKRKPKLVLVDELAHSNIAGSRHPKRWQDVMEILENGIDVYSTLNVQHIESLKDLLEGITGISITETVPDLIVEKADSIELIDITPEELIQRLKEGKVYLGEQSKVAAAHFFQEDRLTALREIVLRYAAEKIDHDLHGMISSVERTAGWKARERLLVAVNQSPHSQKLIRTTRRIAANLDAPWIAVHVNDGRLLDEAETASLSKNLSLARELGAEVMTINDPNISEAIERIALQKGVTQMIIGRPPKRSFFDFFHSFPLLDRLVRECGDIDIHVIRQTSPSKPRRGKQSLKATPESIRSYLIVIYWVILSSCLSIFLKDIFNYTVIGSLFLLQILMMGLFFQKGPLLLAALLYATSWSVLFAPDGGKVFLNNPSDLFLLGGYFLTAIVTGILSDRSRAHRAMLLKREESTQALYEIVKEIASAPSQEQLISSFKERLGNLLEGKCEIILKQLDGNPHFEEGSLICSIEKEKNAALWVFNNVQEAGFSTSTLPSSQYLYIPFKGYNDVVGVLAYKPNNPSKILSVEEMNFIYTTTQQLGNYLERSLTRVRARQVEQLRQKENIHQNVLKLISNELHPPLATIQGAVKKLYENPAINNEKDGIAQLLKIESTFSGLRELLNNISAMIDLSEGAALIISKHPIQELIEVTCQNVKTIKNHHHIKIVVYDDLPIISFDFSLIKLLLHNLICNAIDYSPEGSTIEIEAKVEGKHLKLSVSDEGKGIPQDQLDTIFEKFFRLPGATSPGFGLGLSIAKTIAEIHHGYITVSNREVHGSRFSLYLPLT